MLAAFDVPQYRRLWASNFLNSLSLVMHTLAVGWLALSLGNSPFWVGLAAGLQGVGQLGFGVFGGVLVDRLDKRTVLIVSHLASAAIMAVLGVLSLMNAVALWHVLVAALLQGVIFSLNVPAANAIAYQIVGRERSMNAAAAQMMGWTLSRIAGSMAAGALISRWGVGSSFVVAGGSAVASALVALFIRGSHISPASAELFWRAAGEGIKYAWASDPMRRLLTLSPVVETFGFSFYVMLPVVARDVLHVGASGMGNLSSAAGVGAFAATLVVATLGDYRHKGALLSSTLVAASVSLVLFALSRWYVLSLILVTVVGGALVIYDVMMQTLFQLLSSDEMRGRVFGIYALTYGFTPLGGFVSGAVATAMGAPFSIAVGGGVILTYVLGFLRPVRQIRTMAHHTVAEAAPGHGFTPASQTESLDDPTV